MSTLASDSFTRADSGTLGANWTNVTGFGATWSIVSNQANTPGSASFHAAAYTGISWTGVNDQWAQTTVVAQTSGSDGGPSVRSATSAQTFYFFDINDADTTALGSSMSCSIHKCVAGSFSAVGAAVSLTINANDVLYIEVQGTSLLAKVNGTTQISGRTDSSIASGSAGLAWWSGSSNAVKADDWSAGDFAGAGGSPAAMSTLTMLGVQ